MTQQYKSEVKADFAAGAGARSPLNFGIKRSNHFRVEAFDKNGRLKWVDEFDNLVVDEGLNDSLDKHLKGSAYTAAFYVGLTATAPSVAAGDTMASHVGWTEFTAYSEAVRQTLTLGTVAAKSVDNSASKAVFSINADSSVIGGAFVCTNNTKGGSTGTLYGGGAFSAGDKGLDNGDALSVTVTCTASG